MTVTSWWVCKTCNVSVSLVSETITLPSKQCPLCHKTELTRDTEREWENKYRLKMEA